MGLPVPDVPYEWNAALRVLWDWRLLLGVVLSGAVHAAARSPGFRSLVWPQASHGVHRPHFVYRFIRQTLIFEAFYFEIMLDSKEMAKVVW